MKRKEMIETKQCDRCGNDLFASNVIIHLPHKKQYITLCVVCWNGLKETEIIQFKNRTQEDWNSWWNQEYDKNV